jgi:3',5'-nucleoside bisphosphate phosphatase
MQWFMADMHIHTVLSPCGSLEMAPERIVDAALKKGLDLIAITDHNSTRQCREIMDIGLEKGLHVIGGAEVNTREEVHCIALFENCEMLDDFQVYLDKWLPDIPNSAQFFGHQVWVNRKEEILGEEKRLLWSALKQGIDEVAAKVESLNGLFFPAHIDRAVNGILRQLGFVPEGLKINALEVLSDKLTNDPVFGELSKQHTLICNSDAHTLEQIGQRYTRLFMENMSFNELKLAFANKDGRRAERGEHK